MFDLMCHRPRTQRLGVDAMPRDLFVLRRRSIVAVKRELAGLNRAHTAMLSAGYPWDGGCYRGFQTEPNDAFYIRVG